MADRESELIEKIIFEGKDALRLRMLKNSYTLVEKMTDEDFAMDERMPYWADVWPSSIALARYLLTEMELSGRTMLELGCGLGLASLAAARRGATVIATDYFEEAIAFTKANAELNQLAVETALLDWRDVPMDKKYDVVLGADLLYEERNHAPVADAILKLLKPGGIAILTDPCREVTKKFPVLVRTKNLKVEMFNRLLEPVDYTVLPDGIKTAEILFIVLKMP